MLSVQHSGKQALNTAGYIGYHPTARQPARHALLRWKEVRSVAEACDTKRLTAMTSAAG